MASLTNPSGCMHATANKVPCTHLNVMCIENCQVDSLGAHIVAICTFLSFINITTNSPHEQRAEL